MKRRTRAQVVQLETQILDELQQDHPQSIRHLFYRMTDPRLPEPVDKSERGYKQLQDRLTKMRRGGNVPYDWIVDTTRRGWYTTTYDDPGSFVASVAALYRGPLWADVSELVEVWTESQSLAGVLQEVCEELAVSLYPCSGFSSLTFAYEAARSARRSFEHQGKTGLTILYVGDYDPAGVLIDTTLERELREHLGIYAGLLTFERVAVNPWQITAWDLPTKPRKEKDRRRLDIQATVEAEAIPAGQMRALVRDKILVFLPPGEVDRRAQVDALEQEALRTFAHRIDALSQDEAE